MRVVCVCAQLIRSCAVSPPQINGDSTNALASIGMDFATWTETTPLQVGNGYTLTVHAGSMDYDPNSLP